MCSIGICSAQDDSEKNDHREDLQFGLKTGLNYSNVYDESGDEFVADPKTGFAFGAFLAIPIGELVGIQPEILFSQKGFKGTGVLFGERYNFTRTTSYIDIPIQIAFKPSEHFTFLLGPQYSYLIKKRDVFTSSSFSYVQEQEFKQDNVNKNILGIVGGFDLIVKQFVVSGRMGWDVSKNNGDGSSSTPRYKNNWLQATVGYCF